jgi:FMN phosphatase YigB (HAD superfamily)
MKELGVHHSFMYHSYPDEPLLVVFDIDDTILDLRHAILHVLTSFDRRHGTRFFRGPRAEALCGDENQLQQRARASNIFKKWDILKGRF